MKGEETKVPKNQLPDLKEEEKFSANGFDFKVLNITEDYFFAEVIADNRSPYEPTEESDGN